MYFALYDVTGIQKYIFQSSKLKENMGASTIVANITKQYLYETIEEKCQHYHIDWEKDTNFKMLSNPTLEAEVIYSGGGKAVVAYQQIEVAKKVNQALSEKILLKTGVNLLICVIEKVEGIDFQKDLDQLYAKIHKKKNEYPPAKPMLGLSITELCTRSQRPVSNIDTTESIKKYVPFELYSKQKAAYEFQKEAKNNCLYFDCSKYEMPLDLDDLGRRDGESHIAIIHIDGNSLGKTLQKYLEQYKDYQEAVAFIRTFSAFIAETYREVFKKMTRKLIHAIENQSLERLKLKQKSEKIMLPLRDIVLNGDDVTFVCDARIALSLTKKFLEEIQKYSIPNSDEKLSACAGIAIVKPHFPFQQAYEIAEHCCSYAKAKAKAIHSDTPKSWLDFHIVQGGISEELHQIRQKYYTYPEHKLDKGYHTYHLLWRPWIVGEDDSETELYNIKKFHQIYTEFIKKWPRHRLKQFRNALIQGENETALFLKEAKSRKLGLPKCFDATTLTGDLEVYTSEYITPFFDVLEMLDLYIPVGEEEPVKCSLK
ncbi:MAG TPA: hypothetical protein GX497_10900 [Bacillus bacterium]|nr:hypothetical protein [Bacillus sp. (in: firmicutes)]